MVKAGMTLAGFGGMFVIGLGVCGLCFLGLLDGVTEYGDIEGNVY